jgi:hypothetical protein
VSEHITRLCHLHSNVYEDMDESSEPLFTRSVGERGEVQFWHQTGYGYLPESRVEIAGMAAPDSTKSSTTQTDKE